jgi:uncharacterized protein YcbK (DUF882 family)
MIKFISYLSIAAAVASIFLSYNAWGAETGCRYFHCGDGQLNLATNKGKAKFKGSFRNPDGSYDEAALRQINRVFLAKYGSRISEVSPRLIEFIDFIQDKFNPGGRVTITSGYRSPKYNTGLRNSGRLAAKASLHQYGMASDFWISGVPSEKIWHYVREMGFGGVGYYHGKNVHVDVGPARFWDETSSKVGTDISDDNKLIGIVADKDIYLPGEQIEMRFIRMTVFPIGVNPTFVLERSGKRVKWDEVDDFTPVFAKAAAGKCPKFSGIGEMLGMRWRLPENLKPGRYRVRARFCDKDLKDMPEEVYTPEFEVRKR